MAVHQREGTDARVRGDAVDKGPAEPQRVGLGDLIEQRILGRLQVPRHLLPGVFRGNQGIELRIDLRVDKGRKMGDDGVLDLHQVDILGIVEHAVDVVGEGIPPAERLGELVRALDEAVEFNTLLAVFRGDLHEDLVLDTEAAEGEALFRRARRGNQFGDILLQTHLETEPNEYQRGNGDGQEHQDPVALEEAVQRDKYLMHCRLASVRETKIRKKTLILSPASPKGRSYPPASCPWSPGPSSRRTGRRPGR